MSLSPVLDTTGLDDVIIPSLAVDINATDADNGETTRSRRLSRAGSVDDAYVHEMLRCGSVESALRPTHSARRSQSCDRSSSAHRVRIEYDDEQLRARYERNAHELFRAAFDDANAGSRRTILARKALRYRHILQRVEATSVDVHDPAFDVSACLGIEWHRMATEST